MAVQDWCNVEKHRKDYEIKSEIEERIVEDICRIEDLDSSMYIGKKKYIYIKKKIFSYSSLLILNILNCRWC